MNNTKRTLSIVAIFMAATLVVGTIATTTTIATTQSALAYPQQKKGADKKDRNGNDNGNTITIQKCKQAATQSGFDNNQGQECENLICTHPGENATCVQEGAKTTTIAAAQARPRTCEKCFTTILSQTQLMNVLGSDRSVEQFCALLRSSQFSETEFRQGLIEDNVTPPQADELIACLKAVGIVFRP
jgi:hypothetical protein